MTGDESSPGGEELAQFFPANAEGFVPRAGEIARVTEEDFQDEHKRRHLESFKKSMKDWVEYEEKEEITESVKLFAKRLLTEFSVESAQELEKAMKVIRKELKIHPSKAQLGSALVRSHAEFKGDPVLYQKLKKLERLLLRRAVRTSSGVAVITILTSPGKFSCPHDCWYCPNEPGQPRSYLSTEPAVLRGNQCSWDSAVQFWDRARTLHRNGHTVDKIEVLVLGGTWSGYSHEYQYEFCRDVFFAANVFFDLMSAINFEALDSYKAEDLQAKVRSRRSLEEEQLINEDSKVKIIGLTLETRPDYITPEEIKRLRNYGCTRVQLGVQHTDSAILKSVNRGHTVHHVRRALRLLKSSCYKVDIHLMPDLPNSNPQIDQDMFDRILRDPGLQADQWKIYPCEVTPFTKISEWYADGTYIPYAEHKLAEKPEAIFTDVANTTAGSDIGDTEEHIASPSGEEVLIGLILQVKKSIHPWIRLNRVIRDIPNQSIIAGNSITNLRQVLGDIAHKHGWICPCMRCREVRLDHIPDQAELVIRSYRDNGASEYFISFETPDRKRLLGFLRLRVPDYLEQARVESDSKLQLSDEPPAVNPWEASMDQGNISSSESSDDEDNHDESPNSDFITPYDCLRRRCALIRELHVYGLLVSTTEKKSNADDSRAQHSGYGGALMRTAELLACLKGSDNIAVIAGVGTRNYYRKFGYDLLDTYMYKSIYTDDSKKEVIGNWFANPRLGQPKLRIEHVALDQLPSVKQAEIKWDIVRKVLSGHKFPKAELPTKAISNRAFLAHWTESIIVPKMISEQEVAHPSQSADQAEPVDALPAVVNDSNADQPLKEAGELAQTVVEPRIQDGEPETPQVVQRKVLAQREPPVSDEPDVFGEQPRPQPWYLTAVRSVTGWVEENPALTAGLALAGLVSIGLMRSRR